jgi:predicted transposase/invertase (TIGR01784 family)
MSRYLDPKADITFKRVFGDPRHKERCISLLNALLPLRKDQRIVGIEYMSPEILPVIAPLKNSIADVRCVDVSGRQFLVEMQMEWTDAFRTRIVFNAAKAFVSQLDIGERYENAKPVYSLNFINDCFCRAPRDRDKYYHHYAVFDAEDTGRKIEGLEFVLVELPKFKPSNRAEKKIAELWLRFLTEIGDDSAAVPAELSEAREIRGAVKCLERAAYTRDELFAYDGYWDAVRRERTLMSGKLAEGEAIGIVKGRAEQTAEIALRMKRLGMDAAAIAELTGLGPAEIDALGKGAPPPCEAREDAAEYRAGGGRRPRRASRGKKV